MSARALLTQGPDAAAVHVVLAHGAGASMTSPFMEGIAMLLAGRGMKVTRFEFAYMTAQRATGRRKPPPKAERLAGEYEALLEQLSANAPSRHRVVIGGKSMGGRVASHLADRLHAQGRISGLVCLGYPFHPPRKPDELRTRHLENLVCPTLIVQGTRDPFGGLSEVEGYALSPAVRVHWVPDGDHDLAPPARAAATHAENLAAAADAVRAFTDNLTLGNGAGREAPHGRTMRT